ncbi:hypothetical protein FRB97_004035 [Tulasnella sp. 331]|nr:hypothetical protein FRB97_004035 [Tulasnella sp. 331]KAG8889476.1 hypothetical protein FRB98_004161 [Tulasnella sp. 332]
MGFKEYASRNMGGWAPTGTPILSSTTIKPNTPIVAVSTLDVGGSDTWVFFVSQRNELRFFKNTLGPAHWILGDDSQPLGGDIQSLTATVWKNTNGQSAFSVWWNDMEGNVFSWRYDDSGKWNFDGQANQVTAHGALQVTSWMGRTRTIDIYGGDGTHFQNTKANDWTPAAKVNAVGNTIAVSGTNLPWARFGSPANLYYLDGHGAFSLSSASQPPDMSPSMAPSFDDPQNIVGSRTMAWQNPGQYIAMFAYKKHGSMLSITSKTWAQSTGWSMENTVIPPTLVTGQ